MQTMLIKKAFASFILLLGFVVPTFAFEIPNPDGYVLDQADILSESEEEKIEERIAKIEERTTVEISVLVTNSIGDEIISLLAVEIGNEWGVGKKDKDNGLMVLIAIEDREWFMATGYGLEGDLPDAVVKRIGEYHFPYFFKKGLYTDGILSALDDIESYIKNDSDIVEFYSQSDYYYEFERESQAALHEIIWFMGLLFFAVIKAFLVAISKHKIRNSIILNLIIGTLAYFSIAIWFFIVVVITSVLVDLAAITASLSGRNGGSSTSSYKWTPPSSSSSSSGSSSSSSSGSFGGGSFGGGGAGGSW
jgi:uncharacterized protein